MKLQAATFALLVNLATVVAKDNFLNGGTPDGRNAGINALASYCEQYDNPAESLCSRYCYAQDCFLGDGAVVPQSVCEKTKEKFIELTGETEFPCERPCPCFSEVPAGLPFCQVAPDQSFISVSDGIVGPESSVIFALTTAPRTTCSSLGFVNGEVTIQGGIITEAQAEACANLILASYDINDPSQCTVLPLPPPQRNLRG